MKKYSHNFVEEYDGLVGFGLDRQCDEATVRFYLQSLSDDRCMAELLPRLNEAELGGLFDYVSDLLRRHFSEDEYHRFFLKDEHHHH